MSWNSDHANVPEIQTPTKTTEVGFTARGSSSTAASGRYNRAHLDKPQLRSVCRTESQIAELHKPGEPLPLSGLYSTPRGQYNRGVAAFNSPNSVFA